MADVIDEANELAAGMLARRIEAARQPVPVGVSGECETCGNESPRLIHGECAPCRDRRATRARRCGQ